MWRLLPYLCAVLSTLPPSDPECIFRSFELPLLLFQAMCSGDEPFVEVLLLHEFIRHKVIRTVVFAGDRVFGLFIQVALFGRLLEGMFVVRRLVLLYGWICMAVVSVEAGFGAALTSLL